MKSKPEHFDFAHALNSLAEAIGDLDTERGIDRIEDEMIREDIRNHCNRLQRIMQSVFDTLPEELKPALNDVVECEADADRFLMNDTDPEDDW
ncbi:hypothetical protein LG290_16605 (plasmid) [Halomonas sediminis]